MYFTYIIYSQKFDKFYIGSTKDINKRISQHNSGRSKSTKPYVPWNLVFSKKFNSRSESLKYERYLKSFKSKSYLKSFTSIG